MADQLGRVTAVIRTLGKLPAVGPDEDIYDAGFSSIKALELLLELEATFAVSIPDDRFVAARTPAALSAMITELGAPA